MLWVDSDLIWYVHYSLKNYAILTSFMSNSNFTNNTLMWVKSDLRKLVGPSEEKSMDFSLISGQNRDFSGWSWTFAHSVRFAIHLSMTSRTAGRLSATSTLVSQPETSDPIQPRSTILNPSLHLSHLNTGSLVQNLPAIPDTCAMMNQRQMRFQLSLFYPSCFA